MTPAQAIGMLDRQIAKHGQTITVRRAPGVTLDDVKAFVRGFKPEELVGLLKQGDRSVVLSPTGLGAFGVPSAPNKVAFASGGTATVLSVEKVEIADVLVRVNLVVRGD